MNYKITFKEMNEMCKKSLSKQSGTTLEEARKQVSSAKKLKKKS